MKIRQRIKLGVALVTGSLMLLALTVSACASNPFGDTTATAISTTSPVQGAGASNLWIPDVVDRTAPSIVHVSVRRSDGMGNGTGIVFDSSGSIITNWHVVEEANQIGVILNTGVELEASMLREDDSLDLAILKVEPRDLTPANFGDSDALRVGQDVVSIGYAFGLIGGPSVSRGVVSALDRTVTDRSGKIFEGLIQTDAAINLGSSGGALVNSTGEVIGLNVGTINVGQGANFALDINTVIEGTNRLVSLGERASPGYLGVGGVDVTPYLAFQQALPVSEGFGVRYVDPDSPAADGFQIDDIIVSINDTPIRGKIDFTEFLRTHPRGTDIVVTAIRGDGDGAVIMEIPVTLGAPGT